MKYETLLALARDLTVIDSKTLLAFGEEPERLAVQLSRWVKGGKLIQLRRGMYLLPERLRAFQPSNAYVANLLVRPSYVSLEYALSLHGLIPEAVRLVQSVTTSRRQRLSTALGDFEYWHVSRAWFFGYEETQLAGHSAMVATPEKALLDLIHLSRGEFSDERILGLRLQNLDAIDLSRLSSLAGSIQGPRIARAVERLQRHILAERGETVSL